MWFSRASRSVTWNRRCLVTLLVDDLDARIAALTERGIETGEVERLNESTRKLVVTDPDGNRIGLDEAVS
jgi:predicted enzyme related to lactoylglutathione lyase